MLLEWVAEGQRLPVLERGLGISMRLHKWVLTNWFYRMPVLSFGASCQPVY